MKEQDLTDDEPQQVERLKAGNEGEVGRPKTMDELRESLSAIGQRNKELRGERDMLRSEVERLTRRVAELEEERKPPTNQNE